MDLAQAESDPSLGKVFVNGHLTSARLAARHIVAVETRGLTEPEDLEAGLQRALARVAELMTAVVGPGGYSATLKRALDVLGERSDSLVRVALGPVDAPLAGLAAYLASHGASRAEEAVTDLLCEVIGLHQSFLGEDLTLRLLARRWPRLEQSPQDRERADGERDDG